MSAVFTLNDLPVLSWPNQDPISLEVTNWPAEINDI